VKKLLLASAALALWCDAGWAQMPDARKPDFTSPANDWSGFYVGATAGAAWGQYAPRTSTVRGGYFGSLGAPAVTAAGMQTINATGFVAGLEGGYNWQIGNLLLGLEADLEAVDLNGSVSTGAIRYPTHPPEYTVTSYGSTDWLFTARPRLGWAMPNHWLLYATGGLAVTQLHSDFSFVDTNRVFVSGSVDALKAGYTVGGGVEATLTDRLSVKAEYLFVDFGNTAGSVTANNLLPFHPHQTFAHSAGLSADIVRAGLNYRFGGTDSPSSPNLFMSFATPAWAAQTPLFADWEMETGARLWLSSGNLGAPQPLLDRPSLADIGLPAKAPPPPVPPPPPKILASRLTYGGLDAVSGEVFARVNHRSGLFVKGYLGAGEINKGHLNDEDFPGFGTAYSNTLLSASGHLGYATIDVGYSVWRDAGAKVGPFVGYNYYTQAIDTFGCTQVAGGTVCSPALEPALLTITENASLNSLRVGVSSEVMLTDRLRLTTDAAYVPWVSFSGLDDHLLRQLLIPQSAPRGNGVMLEASMDYFLTPAWSVGVGARYWAWNTSIGSVTFDFLTAPPPITEAARFTAERYGVFAQSSYRWGDPAAFASDHPIVGKAAVVASGPAHWTGFYVGGHLGGGWSDAQWSDPFASTAPLGFVNVAGFGDRTHATGPLGGGQIGGDWQMGRIVVGVEADADAANMHGENTCFSGLGGVNCQHVISALGAITGRVGFAWDRSLAYAKGGGAWTDTSYNVLGNTAALALGAGGTTLDRWGWTVGGGIEYALTNHWSALAEYDHVGISSADVPFPSVAVINTQQIGVRQSVNLFKLGVNYKFELAGLGTITAQ
jgi:opacity protein-like surface antigen